MNKNVAKDENIKDGLEGYIMKTFYLFNFYESPNRRKS